MTQFVVVLSNGGPGPPRGIAWNPTRSRANSEGKGLQRLLLRSSGGIWDTACGVMPYPFAFGNDPQNVLTYDAADD